VETSNAKCRRNKKIRLLIEEQKADQISIIEPQIFDVEPLLDRRGTIEDRFILRDELERIRLFLYTVLSVRDVVVLGMRLKGCSLDEICNITKNISRQYVREILLYIAKRLQWRYERSGILIAPRVVGDDKWPYLGKEIKKKRLKKKQLKKKKIKKKCVKRVGIWAEVRSIEKELKRIDKEKARLCVYLERLQMLVYLNEIVSGSEEEKRAACRYLVLLGKDTFVEQRVKDEALNALHGILEDKVAISSWEKPEIFVQNLREEIANVDSLRVYPPPKKGRRGKAETYTAVLKPIKKEKAK